MCAFVYVVHACVCMWCVWMRVSACVRRVLVGVYMYAGVGARIHRPLCFHGLPRWAWCV